MNGARIGRGVYVNTLSITDHNLLELGDGVVVGENVHVSGHTVEGGIVKTGRVVVGPCVTVGIGSIIGIDVDIGRGCQIGSLSLVPKHTRLEAHSVYLGIPAKRRSGESRKDRVLSTSRPPVHRVRRESR
jgi:acetyltransferase-like isoleucine patch superfamily enzyme